jgi:hypothetical protein
MENKAHNRWLTLNFAATIFVSAFLLFQIQPLVTKYILPWFGGSPAVWTTCLLFFQTLLFAGYAYAHWLHGRLEPRRQASVHIVLLAAAVVMLVMLLPGERWLPRGYHDPVRHILIILTVSVGLPYFALSATGPLLQAWFARSFPGRVPYRLYALSNLGSLLALLSYPFYFESAFDLPTQAMIWSAGFLVFALLCGYAAWRMRTNAQAAPPRGRVSPRRGSESRRGSATDQGDSAAVMPRWHQRLLWLLWPAFGSVVLFATTNHVSADIAAVPFLWVVPLALYLVTFIIAFDRPTWYRRAPVAAVMLLGVYATAFLHGLGVGWRDVEDLSNAGTTGLIYAFFLDPATEFHIATWEFFAVNFAGMFLICLLCHGELVRQRPDPRYLTSFYLMIAAGGALGGVFVTLIAPLIFSTYFEWELSLFLASLIGIGFILRALVDFAFGSGETRAARPLQYVLLATLVLVVFLPSAVMLLDLTELLQSYTSDATFRTRTFFGTLAILDREAQDPLNHHFVLRHGAITHGAQLTHPSRRSEPITYYGRPSGIARTIDYYRRELESDRLKLGVVGLGTGSLAAFADRGDSAVFYEIDPAVIDISEGGRWFTYVQDCRSRGAECEIRLGDARLSLRRELLEHQPQKYHVLVLDAFSGDSIPVHLLTLEAFELYLAHLAGQPASGEPALAGGSRLGGAIAVHISNRYLNLEPIVRGIAQHFGLRALYIESDRDDKLMLYSADWMILTRNAALAEELNHFATPPDTKTPAILWTDERNSLFDVLQ